MGLIWMTRRRRKQIPFGMTAGKATAKTKAKANPRPRVRTWGTRFLLIPKLLAEVDGFDAKEFGGLA
jgi:hypothetical protein